MKIVLATLCLNEMEHLPRLYQQHRNWPGVVKWVFVESADRVYADVNPTLVSADGLSVDGTTGYLRSLAASDPMVHHVPFGIAAHPDPAQGKVTSRQQYLNAIQDVRPDYVVVLDADEYYTKAHQEQITNLCTRQHTHDGLLFRQRHIWRPASIQYEPLFSREVVKGYWAVPHCRVWRWYPGMRYHSNHNTPELPNGMSLGTKLARFDVEPGSHPECIHLGFASTKDSRHAKHIYYVARGEGRTDGRQQYVDCRAAFETWTPSSRLPHGAKVIKYLGPVPEVFQ